MVRHWIKAFVMCTCVDLILPPEQLQLFLLVTELCLAAFAPLLGAAQLKALLGVVLRQFVQVTVRDVRPRPDEWKQELWSKSQCGIIRMWRGGHSRVQNFVSLQREIAETRWCTYMRLLCGSSVCAAPPPNLLALSSSSLCAALSASIASIDSQLVIQSGHVMPLS